ncbi:hypothetical protein [Pseudomonas sp. 2FG]|uniref:hypothetical protein n=1 Tax=Pseudomonas sp. 2FG TaxID=2502191 RepID=UPI0010F56538|nr:hypothetical protein [Pseudomonas sp. 2FG]
MTRRITLSLDLNENDLDALQIMLANPAAIARSVAPNDPREQIRIVDVLAEIARGVTEAAIDKQVASPEERRGRST